MQPGRASPAKESVGAMWVDVPRQQNAVWGKKIRVSGLGHFGVPTFQKLWALSSIAFWIVAGSYVFGF